MRRRRMIVTAIVLVGLAFGGSLVLVAFETVTPHPSTLVIAAVIAAFAVKLPLIALCGWLIYRNKEIPGVPVVWSADETREILEYLRAQARDAPNSPEAGPRLAYLAQEAWHVADQADDALKPEAVAVALEIRDRAERLPGVR